MSGAASPPRAALSQFVELGVDGRALRIEYAWIDTARADAPLELYRQICRCRKPGPGMIEQACRDMDLDASRSFTIGDRWLDVACGRAAGTRAVLVLSGPHKSDAPDGVHADAILNNLMEAVGWILRSSSRS